MSFILGLLVAAKGIALAVGIVFSGSSPVTVSSPRLTLTDDKILLSCRLSNAFNDELSKLAASGTEIPLYLMVETRGDDGVVERATVQRTLVFDILQGRFLLLAHPPPDTARFSSRDSALAAFTRFNNVPALSLEKIQPRGRYSFVIYAILGKTRVEALEGGSLDLMYYWRYRRPLIKTEPFRGSELLKVKLRSGS